MSVLARGARHDWIRQNGLILVNEITGEKDSTRVRVLSDLEAGEAFDLVIVLVRKNKLPPIFELLAAREDANLLFMGNNALGFDEYREHLPAEKLVFGFPGAGGGLREEVVHYADREKPRAARRAVTLGEIDGTHGSRLSEISSLFESADVPVDRTPDIDGWLKYHAALVLPLVYALYKHDCDARRTAGDKETLRAVIRGAKEGGRVLRALGFTKRQPFQFNLFYWLPEALSVKAVKELLTSRFAEIAFAMHAESARDEMRALTEEFRELTTRTSVATPNLDALRAFIA